MITLGIDTSNYTTSIALTDSNGELVLDLRKPLIVKKNSIGLRQSDAFYQHMKQLNEMLEIVKPYHNSIKNIVVSSQPRNVDKSYMPVFNAGVFFAQTLNFENRFKMIEISHQEGHILSGWNKDLFQSPYFYALHISGGTTELLKVKLTNERIVSEIVNATLDISFGQLIDRVGNHMGFDFPSGKAVDSIAKKYIKTNYKISNKADGFNLSGIENKLKVDFNTFQSQEQTSEKMLSYITDVIQMILKENTDDEPVLIVGGVGESQFIRKHLNHGRIYYTKSGYSSDNAVGLSKYPFIMEKLCN